MVERCNRTFREEFSLSSREVDRDPMNFHLKRWIEVEHRTRPHWSVRERSLGRSQDAGLSECPT